VKGKQLERWQQLCALAAVEQDGEKLLEITKEIIRLLDEKETRLKSTHSPEPTRMPSV
jgi:hypothetical protein